MTTVWQQFPRSFSPGVGFRESVSSARVLYFRSPDFRDVGYAVKLFAGTADIQLALHMIQFSQTANTVSLPYAILIPVAI